MLELIVSTGDIVFIDEVDSDLKSYNWCLAAGYPYNDELGYLHKTIGDRMELRRDRQVDHEDRNKLNCTRRNLRSATMTEQRANSKIRSDNTSGYKGVSFHRQTGKWLAQLYYQGRAVHLGLHDSAIRAAEAYDYAAKRYFGKFARPNFPE